MVGKKKVGGTQCTYRTEMLNILPNLQYTKTRNTETLQIINRICQRQQSNGQLIVKLKGNYRNFVHYSVVYLLQFHTVKFYSSGLYYLYVFRISLLSLFYSFMRVFLCTYIFISKWTISTINKYVDNTNLFYTLLISKKK